MIPHGPRLESADETAKRIAWMEANIPAFKDMREVSQRVQAEYRGSRVMLGLASVVTPINGGSRG